MNNTDKQNNTQNTGQSKVLCKLGIDTHAHTIMVARQVDSSTPQPPQRFTPKSFLVWVKKLVETHQVVSCYEAGPTGYWLHRQLQALGVTNHVVCPTRLDSRGKGVNTDKTDALELVVRLDRYVAGNRKALSVVQVPTPEQERKRMITRQREQLRNKRLSFAAQGRMLLLSQGFCQSNSWWKKTPWHKLQELVPDWLLERLAPMARIIEAINQEIKALEKQIEQAAPKSLPAGMGALTNQVFDVEVRDWNGFKNRRQIGSYSGLCGGVSSSGRQHADLSITKAGNKRLSTCAVECAWRMFIYQPNYWLVRKMQRVLLDPKTHVRRRKRLIVAFARQMLVDIWKWKTGRVTPEQLGWVMT